MRNDFTYIVLKDLIKDLKYGKFRLNSNRFKKK